ncbi:MAG TPA: glycoside hydrolase family 16 protein [Marmoricola sp.]|jgi:beta-glucanase (GH16 family)|nr:glycoside hydrolase family 16 protein [Marmoricola sp.]
MRSVLSIAVVLAVAALGLSDPGTTGERLDLTPVAQKVKTVKESTRSGSRPAPKVRSAARTDACGPVPTKADGSPWSCTFHDDFEGTALDRSVWTPQRTAPSGSNGVYACYADTADNIAVSGGELRLTARADAAPQDCGATTPGTYYTGATVMTYHTFSQQYGRFEARMKNTAAQVPGLHEAFWMWPDDRYSPIAWPASGEIDVAETYSQYPDLAVPYLHYTADDNGGPVPGLNTAWNCHAARGVWNTYTLEWTPERLSIYVNGSLCLQNTSADPAFHKPYLLLLSQAIGVGTNAVTAETPFPATVSVDYVRAWR